MMRQTPKARTIKSAIRAEFEKHRHETDEAKVDQLKEQCVRTSCCALVQHCKQMLLLSATVLWLPLPTISP